MVKIFIAFSFPASGSRRGLFFFVWSEIQRVAVLGGEK